MDCTKTARKDAYSVKIRVWIGTSHIVGKGLFAVQGIKKGTRIIQYIGQRIYKEKTADRLYQGNQYIFTFNDRYDALSTAFLKNGHKAYPLSYNWLREQP